MDRAILRRVLLAAVVAALLVAAALSCPLKGQSKVPGVGYVTPPGSRATWQQKNQPGRPIHVRPMDVSQHPWPSGIRAQAAGGWIEDQVAFFKRYGVTAEEFYVGQFYPAGYSNEHYPVTYDCLQLLCERGLWSLGPATLYDCVPTAEEAYDAALRNREDQGLYAACFALRDPAPKPTCPPCPTCKPCPPERACPPLPPPCPDREPCPPTLECRPPRPSPRVLRAMERLAAAADLSEERRVTIGPALRGYWRQVEQFVREVELYQPGLPSTGRLDVKVVKPGPNTLPGDDFP